MALRWILRSSDRIVLPSHNYRSAFVRRFPAMSAKAVCIHNGVDLDRFHSEQTDAPREDRYILFVGRIAEPKGLDVLLHAASSVLAGNPRLRVAIVGDGPLKTAMQSLAFQLGIQDKTVFLGAKRPEEVAALLRGCEVFVLPSRAESFGIVILEAMACKRPVIATTVGGIPEIITNGENGLLVPPDDATALAGALRRVLSDKALQDMIAFNAYRTVRDQFAFDRTASAYERAFNVSPGTFVESRTQGFVGHDAQTK
jgi:glycosyltransferase involved in cell wall biosynthesis